MAGERFSVSADEQGWMSAWGSQTAEALAVVGLGLANEQGRPGLRGLAHTARLRRPGHPVTRRLLSADWI